jgi:hypothetical protein
MTRARAITAGNHGLAHDPFRAIAAQRSGVAANGIFNILT